MAEPPKRERRHSSWGPPCRFRADIASWRDMVDDRLDSMVGLNQLATRSLAVGTVSASSPPSSLMLLESATQPVLVYGLSLTRGGL